MIYRLRKKFIKICTLSFLGVFVVLFSSIYAITFCQTTLSLDELADIVSENNGSFPEFQTPAQPAASDLRPAERNPEAPFTTRFFTVQFDGEGNFLSTDVRSIASVTEEEAANLGKQALSERRERGWAGGYRYKVYTTEEGQAVVCVSASSFLDMNRNFLTAACLVFAGGSLVVLLLVILFSKRAVRPVAESYQRQKQFVTDANHELKTPLTLIRANLDILEGETGPNEWLSDIREETGLMSQLVGRLVTLARMDEESQPLEALPFDLAAAVWETASAFTKAAETAGKALSIKTPDSLSYKGDEAALRQLVSILLDNAVKYCDPGGFIQVELQGGRHPVLTVDNSCQAVGELPLSRLFDRFYRADPARTYGSGFGIGLSIAKGIVERHRGEITAHKLNSAAIRFRVKL